MNDEQLNRIEEKLNFLIFMHMKTVTQPPALAGQKPRVVILPGEMLFKQWQDANRKAGEEKGKQNPENPFKRRIPDENGHNPDNPPAA